MIDFNQIPKERIIFKNELFFIIKDQFPVSPGHLLIISKGIKKDFFELSLEEKEKLPKMIDKAKQLIKQEYNPDGYNIGMNCGDSAGQTIFHFHCHIIPRYKGDMDNPRGGVRGVIPSKRKY
ncbi:HIT family protein [Polaribacter dokdonensis]|uniref:Diadenosine tetraphosphate (Ap4A) hydrolase n=1 Tax=Polaribacter dokdonensis DSW-5 TaxID=1300348 RepID=A0A0M9CHA7_9FLAO|nr:HIT family protein [Polaribacter dokdonensis]KOY51945.1 Histidine triad (HIT) protein [Polaribacter dokdonensis DSW-5]SED99299.1 Diadenosine tetraphosphate (Ap4A) hydrolase [Polaribacter dokdonensis DSW-5]